MNTGRVLVNDPRFRELVAQGDRFRGSLVITLVSRFEQGVVLSLTIETDDNEPVVLIGDLFLQENWSARLENIQNSFIIKDCWEDENAKQASKTT
jgi:hypothetical protein